jgi:hypothetical protein
MTGMSDITALRFALSVNGYTPLPLFGKAPPNENNNSVRGLTGWQHLKNVTRSQCESWRRLWEDAKNTGILTRDTPAFDLDILNEEAAIAAEGFIRERVEERGHFLVRIGFPPKRAFLFQTDNPFDKITVNFTQTRQKPEKIEFLANGQQLAVDGIHPDTHRPYNWFGGEPWKIKREELPYISAEEAQHLVDDVVELLTRDFGYKRAADRPKHTKGNGNGQSILNDQLTNEADWEYLFKNILEGDDLHDSVRDLAGKLIASGMKGGAAVNSLRALMNRSSAPHDDRWQERFDDISRAVQTALNKGFAPEEEELDEEEQPTTPPPPQQPPGAGSQQQGPGAGQQAPGAGSQPGTPPPGTTPPPGASSQPGAQSGTQQGSTPRQLRFKLHAFDAITLSTEPDYLVKGILPRTGLAIFWGPPKCGKSFKVFDLAMHIALGWQYRGRKVRQGPVVYCAVEGGHGFRKRIEAWRLHHVAKFHGPVPFWLIDVPIDLIKDYRTLIADIRAQTGGVTPSAVVIDTLNRSLNGSESDDEDMAKYMRAADAIRAAFNCVTPIVHHCGIAGTRPRGHTSLSGACDAQGAVVKDENNGNVTLTVEFMKDDDAGTVVVSELKVVQVGIDDDKDPITSCVCVPAKGAAGATSATGTTKPGKKLTPLQVAALRALTDCLADMGKVPPASNHIPSGIPCVTLDAWREYLGKHSVINLKGSYREQFRRLHVVLNNAGKIGIWNDLVWTT